MGQKRTGSQNRSKKFQIELTTFSATLWSLLLLFLLSWIFVLGILVGRGFMPESMKNIADLKGQIVKLQEMVNHKKSVENETPSQQDPDPKLAFYNELINKKDVAKQKSQTPPTATTQKKDVPAKSESVDKAAETNHTVQIPRPTPETNSAMSILEFHYTVQLASLGDKEKADIMVNDLIKQSFPAYYYATKVRGTTYYRVRCGKFVTKEEAQAYAHKLTETLGLKGFVTRIE